MRPTASPAGIAALLEALMSGMAALLRRWTTCRTGLGADALRIRMNRCPGTALGTRTATLPLLSGGRTTIRAGRAGAITPGPHDIRSLQRARLGAAAMTMLMIAAPLAGGFRPASLRGLRTIAIGRGLRRRSAIGIPSRNTCAVPCRTGAARLFSPLARSASGSVARTFDGAPAMRIAFARIARLRSMGVGRRGFGTAIMGISARRPAAVAVSHSIATQKRLPLCRT